jgi:hypothetical protein
VISKLYLFTNFISTGMTFEYKKITLPVHLKYIRQRIFQTEFP